MGGSLVPPLTDADLGPRPPSLGRRGRRRRSSPSSRSSPGGPSATTRRIVRLARRRGRPVRDPGRRRRAAGADPACAWTQTLHLALGAVIWALLAGLDRHELLHGPGRRGGRRGRPGARQATPTAADGAPRPRGDTVRAYIALTKPRIIELLLVTTVPGDGPRDARGARASTGATGAWLVFWTLVGGTLAAGSANAINCYLDRDIDELMARTRRRPLPAHQVEPGARGRLRARARGHLVRRDGLVRQPARRVPDAARDRVLRRRLHDACSSARRPRTSSSAARPGRCRRSSAGRRSPGNVGIPALLLFALVFYWTPPHFWALSLRIRKDYAAAGVPMLPVVKGIPETTRQIGLYTILMVAISLVLLAVARMGADLPRRGGRARRDLPVAGVRAVAARLVRGGLDRRARSRSTGTRSAT